MEKKLVIVQIAGLIARRIVCEVEQGQDLKQGERIGMIRFGSRVDIYFKNKKVLAKLGQNVVARRKFNSFRLMEENKKFKLVTSKKTRYLLTKYFNFSRSLLGYKFYKIFYRW